MPTFHRDDEIATLTVDTLVIAGWTGRDTAGVEHHIRELAALGVAPPSEVPLFYRVASDLLVGTDRIQVVGAATSGEAEPLIVQRGARRWLGLASDHTDRALEAHSVALSKQACAKPCAGELWALDEIADRLDELELRSWIPAETDEAGSETGGPDTDDERAWTLYQEGTLAALRPLAALLEASPLGAITGPHPGSHDVAQAMLCGTLPAIGGVRPAERFRFELHDPATGRTLRHEYAVDSLPEID